MLHKIISKQRNSKLCFVCGLKNDFGLHAHFYVDENQKTTAEKLIEQYEARLREKEDEIQRLRVQLGKSV